MENRNMTDHRRSKQALNEFIAYLGDKGLMAPNTVNSRKAALKVLDVLEPSEAEDVTAINVNDVVLRFENRNRNVYDPGSLQAYKARLKATLNDFRAYLENPLGFRPKTRPKLATKPKSEAVRPDKIDRPTEAPRHTETVSPPGMDILPIPIRPNLTVRIYNLPYDLTPAEAGKIAAVVQAMAMRE